MAFDKYNAWLKGEIRVDGFQSPWLKDTLRRRAEEAAALIEAKKEPKPKLVRKPLPVKPKRYFYPPDTMGEYRYRYQMVRAKRREGGLCVDCGGHPREGLRTCQTCSDRRKPYMKKSNAARAVRRKDIRRVA